MALAATRSAPDGLRLRLFGEVRLWAAGADITPRARKARGLIAFLAVAHEQTSTRERIADLLWSDRGEIQARASLRQILTELRSGAIGELSAITIDREFIRLAPRALATDAQAIEAACSEEDIRTLERELGPVREGFLRDLDGLSPSFDEWLAGERAQQQDRIVARVIRLVESILAERPTTDLRGVVASLESIDPGNELITRLGLRLDRALGDTTGARRRYRRLDDYLRDQLGVSPGAETRALFEAFKTFNAPATVVSSLLQEQRATFAERAALDPVAAIGEAPPLLYVAEFIEFASEAPSHLTTAIRHEILSGLSRFPDLRLAAAKEGGGVGTYTLTATLRASGTGLAINPQLLRGGDGKLIWADRFDLPREDLQPAIDTVIGRVVGAVLPAVVSDLVSSLAPRPAPGPYGRFLLARHAAQRPANYRASCAAAAELETIIAAEPNFAPPKLALARIYNTDFVWTRAGSSTPDKRARALELARTSLAIDESNVNAWTIVAWGHLWHGNWQASEQHFDAALTLTPYNVPRLLEVAFGRIFLGDLEGSAVVIDHCLGIERRASDGLHADRGLLRLIQGDFEGAQADFEMVAAPYFESLLHAAANAALAGRSNIALRAQAKAQIASMHEDDRTPSTPLLIAWLRSSQPFRYDEHWNVLREGVELAFS